MHVCDQFYFVIIFTMSCIVFFVNTHVHLLQISSFVSPAVPVLVPSMYPFFTCCWPSQPVLTFAVVH